jgi:serine/threonine protein kinase
LQHFGPDLAEFEESSVIGQSNRGSTRIYRRWTDGALVVVKSFSFSPLIERCQIKTEIENLFNLRHPLIAPLVGSVLPVESGGSLTDILLNPPAWWTPTAKAKAVAEIALALRFAHGLGLLHGALNAGNVLFDAPRRIEIAEFSTIRLESDEVEPFSREKWTPASDVSAFASRFVEIAIGASGGSRVSATVPEFVSRMIEDGRSFVDIVDIVDSLMANGFEIVTGVDCEEVSAFVTWVESAEQSDKWE